MTAAQNQQQKQWYVLRVQTGREESVRLALEKRAKASGADDVIGRVLVPIEKITQIRGGKKQVREQKLYPGYVMVELEMSTKDDKAWFFVRETPGVGDFIGAEERPLPMTDGEVGKMLGQNLKVDTEEPAIKVNFRVGDPVRIKDGTFVNYDGVVKQIMSDKGRVEVMVTIFGRQTPVDLEYWQVESI